MSGQEPNKKREPFTPPVGIPLEVTRRGRPRTTPSSGIGHTPRVAPPLGFTSSGGAAAAVVRGSNSTKKSRVRRSGPVSNDGAGMNLRSKFDQSVLDEDLAAFSKQGDDGDGTGNQIGLDTAAATTSMTTTYDAKTSEEYMKRKDRLLHIFESAEREISLEGSLNEIHASWLINCESIGDLLILIEPKECISGQRFIDFLIDLLSYLTENYGNLFQTVQAHKQRGTSSLFRLSSPPPSSSSSSSSSAATTAKSNVWFWRIRSSRDISLLLDHLCGTESKNNPNLGNDIWADILFQTHLRFDHENIYLHKDHYPEGFNPRKQNIIEMLLSYLEYANEKQDGFLIAHIEGLKSFMSGY